MSAPDHKTGPMRPLTGVEVAATAATRWRAQYQGWSDFDKFSDGTTKGETNDRLNREAHTPANIAEILNAGWAYPTCSCCEKRWPVVVEFKSEWADESHTICAPCLLQAALILGQFPGADVPVDAQ